MPLKIPNLDDRNYTDLVDEAISMLPRYAPEWTNHNPSDPGITLIELIAYFSELFIYRLNRVTKDTKIRFLQLLIGSNGEATTQYPDKEKVLRAKSFARQNLQTADEANRDADAPGHMSVVVLPASELERDKLDALLEQVWKDLEPKRVLTTRLHVVQPFYLWVALDAKIHTRPDAPEDMRARAREKAIARLKQYFNPWPDVGPQGDGWPFGRALYLSEVLGELEQVEGVDYVEDLHAVRMSTSGAPEDHRTIIGIQP